MVLRVFVKRDFRTRIGQVAGGHSAVRSIFAALAAGVAVPVSEPSAGVSLSGRGRCSPSTEDRPRDAWLAHSVASARR